MNFDAIKLKRKRGGSSLFFGFSRYFPVDTRRYLDVDLTSFERYGRQMDVKTSLCAYWKVVPSLKISSVSSISNRALFVESLESIV